MPRESQQHKRQRVEALLQALRKRYPNPRTALHHRNAWELLVATILSAQCTDQKVNEVTPELFEHYPTPEHFARADRATLEKEVYSTGFYQKKARALIETAQDVVDKFGGELPDTLEELITLRGVARKTANVLLGQAYGKASGVVVDTHVARLALRLGLSPQQKTKTLNTGKIERDLMGLIPQEQWIFAGSALIWHGRETCDAKRPRCDDCVLSAHCPKRGVPKGK